jgi:hypothetical protein
MVSAYIGDVANATSRVATSLSLITCAAFALSPSAISSILDMKGPGATLQECSTKADPVLAPTGAAFRTETWDERFLQALRAFKPRGNGRDGTGREDRANGGFQRVSQVDTCSTIANRPSVKQWKYRSFTKQIGPLVMTTSTSLSRSGIDIYSLTDYQ